MDEVKTAVAVRVADIWQGKSSEERKAWLKKAAQDVERWYTTTFEDLPKDVQLALEGAK